MEYTYQQKIAMMCILLDIINADGIIDVRETYFFNQLMIEFELCEGDRIVAKERNSLLALVQLNDMSSEQKEYFAHLMSKMIIVDEDINVNEVAIYEVVSKFCNIGKNFNDHGIPENITYS